MSPALGGNKGGNTGSGGVIRRLVLAAPNYNSNSMAQNLLFNFYLPVSTAAASTCLVSISGGNPLAPASFASGVQTAQQAGDFEHQPVNFNHELVNSRLHFPLSAPDPRRGESLLGAFGINGHSGNSHCRLHYGCPWKCGRHIDLNIPRD